MGQDKEASFFAAEHFPAGTSVLDIGCGPLKKVPWAIGIDRVKSEGTDVVHDLTRYPWPFPDDTFDHLIVSHIAEHMPDLEAFCRELHRISKSGASIRIVCPHHSNPDAFVDPTHVRYMAYRSFDFFSQPEDAPLPRAQVLFNRFFAKGTPLRGWYTEPYFKIVERHLTFRTPHRWLGFEYLARHLPLAYEYLLEGWAPAVNVLYLLEVRKSRKVA